MVDLVQKAARQARHYWMADGWAELLIGAGFLIYGGLLKAGGYWGGIAAAVWPLVLVLGGRRLLLAAKARWTAPRSGYVVYRREPRWERLGALLAGLLLVALGGVIWRGWDHWVGAFFWLPALLLGLLAWRMAHPRLWAYAFWAALLAWGALSGWLGWPGLYAALGGALLLGGAWAQWTWRRRFPAEVSDAPSA